MPVRLSIITPSYNQAAFLDETLRSIIAQREFIHEWFVIDGGSTDGSVDIIRSHAAHIDHWVSEKDQGQSDAIHKGFSRATGDFLYWLNSDDVLLPQTLQKVHAALEQNPSWDALTGYHVRMDDRSKVISAHRIPPEDPARALWGMHHVIQQTCFFRRSLYEQIGGLDLSLDCVMDTDLWCRMFDAGSHWGHLPQYLAGFRQHAAAKGSAQRWMLKYRAEEKMLQEKYPQYCAINLKHQVGLLVYRASQIFSGRHPLALRDARRWRGKTLAEVFHLP
jgi:glycosyltransferase involved in cell wall biosynthesis